MASCRIQENKKKAKCFINPVLLGCMMTCEVEFVDWAAKCGRGGNELSFWWFCGTFNEVENQRQSSELFLGKRNC